MFTMSNSEKKHIVTQNDVAQEAGVTRSMVSYVISGTAERSVAPETRRRILDAIEKLGYRPNKAAQALQQGDVAFASKKIGVVLCNADVFRRPYYAEILSGIHTAAYEHKYQVAFIRFFEELRDPVLFNELIHPEEIGGLILVSIDQVLKTDDDYKILSTIRERIQKIVCVDWKCEGLTNILFDRQEAAYKASEYLFHQGYNDIGYIGENDERVLGVRQSLLERGIFTSEKDFYLVQAFNMTGGYDGVRELLKTRSLPRAVVCGSDEVAIGVMSCLNERKISIPEQVAVISIDNIETASYTTPPLTTINVQKTAMGARAVEAIVGSRDKKIAFEPVNIFLPTSIVVRKSC